MGFEAELRERAATLKRRIAFAEAHDGRVSVAIREVAVSGIALPVIVFDSTAAVPLDPGIAHEVIDTAGDPRTSALALLLAAQAAEKGLLDEDAQRQARSPLTFANYLLREGDVDGVVAGAEYTTAAVLRSALTLIGRASGVGSVSGAFYMILPPFRNEGEEVLTFADCAVIREPTAEQLAGIAVSAAHDRRRIVGDEPVVALLSYSTRGSAGGRSVEVVREALKLIRIADAGLMVDGEMQADAALTRDVAHRKAPGSVVGGRANVLIFPSLDAGNIAYKLVQRIAGAGAVGPILQGLARPCNDLSRGSTSNDIINVAAVTALQGADPS